MSATNVLEGNLCKHINVAPAANKSLATKTSGHQKFPHREHRLQTRSDGFKMPIGRPHLATCRLERFNRFCNASETRLTGAMLFIQVIFSKFPAKAAHVTIKI